MGAPMAQRLAEAGYAISVWNRTRSRAEHLSAFGADVFDTPFETARDATIVITMLESGPVVDAVLFPHGASTTIERASMVIDMSSIPPSTASEHAVRLEDLGIGYLDAPVSGGTRGAADGTLTIMAGGKPSDFERCRDVLAVFGNASLVGPPGSGQIAKLANQIIVGVTIGAVAEAFALVRAAGVDPAIVRRALKGGFADSRILNEHGARMIEADFEPGAASRIQLKDLATANEVASHLGIELPITSVVEVLFDSLCKEGGSELDHSALLLEIERSADSDSQRDQT